MRKLRFVGLSEDGRDLVVADPDGLQMALPLDGAVSRAVAARLERLERAAETRLSPRQIQTRLRAGESAEEIAHTTGLTIEQVVRFEGPVLEERAYQARQALAGNTGSGDDSVLGDRVNAHFAALGLDPQAATWDSWRRDNGTWTVQLEYTFGGRVHAAGWIWEPAARRVQPYDGLAHAISGVDPPAGDDLTAVLSPLRGARGPRSPAARPTERADPTDSAGGDAAAPTRRSRRSPVPAWADIVSGERPTPPS